MGGITLLSALVSVLVGATEPQDVAFTSKYDHSSQRYVLLRPDAFDPAQPHDLLIALHGHGSDRWQFVNDPRDECRAARDFAARRDMIYVSPDYRAKTSWMGPAAEADMVQIVEEINTTYRIGRVYLCGGSMGGTSALIFAIRQPELVNGVVAMNATANIFEYSGFKDAIAESYGGSRDAVPQEYKARNAELHAQRLTMPVALTTGGKDTVVPPESALRLAETLRHLDRKVLLIHRPDEAHSTTYTDAERALEFVFANSRRPAPSQK